MDILLFVIKVEVGFTNSKRVNNEDIFDSKYHLKIFI